MGLAAMTEKARDILSAWEGFRIEPEEYREIDDERVLVLIHVRGRGKASGVDLGKLRTAGATVFHVRDGKVTRRVVYFDRERALADLGLAQESNPPDRAPQRA
jgi:ketosteroid isomerase-like protein